MTRMRLSSVLFATLLIAPRCGIVYAGWGESIRLTYRGNEINPQVIGRNDTVHVAWEQGFGNVSYIRSTDGGATWEPIMDLNEMGHYGQYANLNLGENGLLVSWMDNNHESIAISKSADGSVWEGPSYVWTDNIYNFTFPGSAVEGDSVFLVYYSFRDDSTGLSPIRAMHSYDYGQTWSDEVTVGHPFAMSQHLVAKYCSGNVFVFWTGVPDSNHIAQDHIIGYRSTDAGGNWSDTIWISPVHEFVSQEPCAVCNSETDEIAVGYEDSRYQQYAFHGDIFAAISDDGGLTWPREAQASVHHTAINPTIEYVQDTLLAVWSDMQFYPEGSHEIVYNRSNDDGLNWQGEYRLTSNPEESLYPWVAYACGHVHVVWMQHPQGSGSDIFYKKYTPDNTESIDRQLPGEGGLSLLADPNPFNGFLQITVSADRAGTIGIYDIQGRTVIEFPFIAGTSRMIWDGKDKAGYQVSSGTYLLGVKGGDNGKFLKIINLK